MTKSPGRPARLCRSKWSMTVPASSARDCSATGGYLHLYSRESPCSKGKEKNMNGGETKQQRHKKKGGKAFTNKVEKAKIHRKPSQQRSRVRVVPS